VFVEKALEAKPLAVLSTALGKTVIARLLHRHTGCRMLLVAPTNLLALQLRESPEASQAW